MTLVAIGLFRGIIGMAWMALLDLLTPDPVRHVSTGRPDRHQHTTRAA